MKIWFYLILLTIIPTLPAHGQETTIQGLVVETGSKTPVRGAVVTIRKVVSYKSV